MKSVNLTYRHLKIKIAYISILLSLICLLIMFGCVKNEWIIEDRRSEESVNSSDNDKNKYIVYFNSRMVVSTSSDVTLFPKDCKAQIFVFIDTEWVQSQESPVYESLTAGTLTPTAKPMVLLKGTYNFYAVSVKTDTLPPPFSNNIANYLANGTDYLWDGIEDYGITVDGTVINVVFSHCASRYLNSTSTLWNERRYGNPKDNSYRKCKRTTFRNYKNCF